ncbi:MAG: LysM peptidoglycan-binding domain-containing protein [Desulfurellaceae bacterium]|nr:LysM peptidoglycan-binding domain-containing protein [Desulfurellaceae bacterium]
MTWWIVFLSGMLWVQSAWATADISPALLGMYRKTIEIETGLFTHAARYGVDHRLARAVILQESGGNAEWVSPGGGVGYFQMPPGIVRLLGSPTNIEAGIQYLAQLQNQFTREDYVLAAYKLGPDRVQEDEPIHFKTLQYIVSIGYYKSVLQEYEPEVRRRAGQLELRKVQPGESWESTAQALRLTPTVLRLYNPMLAKRFLQGGSTVAYPTEVPADLAGVGEKPVYVVRIGDTPELLANVFQVDPQTFRQQHQLWYLHPLAAGKEISLPTPPAEAPDRRTVASLPPQIPSAAGRGAEEKKNGQDLRYTVRRGDSLERIARRYGTTVRALRAANSLRGTQINIGAVLRIPTGQTETTLYRVQWGDTLGKIAQRYNTTIATLVRINNLRNHRIQAGRVLRIPSS